MDNLIETGSVRRGWLGVSIQDLTPELAEQFGIERGGGALVAEVIDDTPAAKADLEAGDVIVEIDGEPIKDSNDLRNTIARIKPDTKTEFTIVRDGEQRTLTVKLGERPDRDQLARGRPPSRPADPKETSFAGMTVANMTEAIADQLGISPDVNGVVVVDVETGSRADRADVMIGDVILRVNRMKVTDVSEFKTAAGRAGDRSFLIQVSRGGRSLFMVVPKA